MFCVLCSVGAGLLVWDNSMMYAGCCILMIGRIGYLCLADMLCYGIEWLFATEMLSDLNEEAICC